MPKKEAQKPVTAHVKKVRDDWEKKSNGSGLKVRVSGSYDSVVISNVVTEDNKVSVWLNGSTAAEPDYVIVNPPTEVLDGTETIEDPITAIATAIHGAKR